MKPTVKLIGLVLAATPLVGAAQDAQQNSTEQKTTELSCIKDVTYSEAFIKKYPRAGAACREVQMRNGEKWIRFVAKVADVKGDQFTANFIDEFKNTVESVTFAAKPGDKVSVNGKETDVADLSAGDTLDFWWPVSRLGFYAQPGAEKMKELRVVSVSPSDVTR